MCKFCCPYNVSQPIIPQFYFGCILYVKWKRNLDTMVLRNVLKISTEYYHWWLVYLLILPTRNSQSINYILESLQNNVLIEAKSPGTWQQPFLIGPNVSHKNVPTQTLNFSRAKSYLRILPKNRAKSHLRVLELEQRVIYAFFLELEAKRSSQLQMEFRILKDGEKQQQPNQRQQLTIQHFGG